MSDELKPCPFCGSNNLIEGYHSPFVICDDCGAFGPGHADLTHDEAVEAWNSRAERTCKWELEHSGTLYGKWRCSKCGYLFVEPRCDQGYTDLEPNYCPNCGCKVVGE